MSIRCLIVDDNEAFLTAARVLLERQGLTVAVASTDRRNPASEAVLPC